MRIGIDVGRALHGQGGVAIYTRELVRGLASSAVDHPIVCFDLDHGVSERAVLEHCIGPVPARMRFEKASRRALADLDIFHAPGFIMPRQTCRRVLFTLYDLTVLSLPECHTLENRARTLDSIVQALCRRATMLGISEATRDEATRLLCLPSDEIEILPPMLDPVFRVDGDEAEDQEILRREGIEKPYCLAVGSLEPRKNLGRLLEAWQSLPKFVRKENHLVILAIAEWKQAAVRHQIEELSRQRSLVLLDQALSGSEMAALYRGAEALVFPSLAEGFGLPIAECMACGTAVITSDRSSMPEVAGEAAILVDPENTQSIAKAIDRLLSDDELSQNLGIAGLEQSRRYSREIVLPSLLEIYGRTIEASRPL